MFKGNVLITKEHYDETIKLYVEELVNNGAHSCKAAEMMKQYTIEAAVKNPEAFEEINNRFLGAQSVAWAIHNGDIKLNAKI